LHAPSPLGRCMSVASIGTSDGRVVGSFSGG
jgi:hypothetical protein